MFPKSRKVWFLPFVWLAVGCTTGGDGSTVKRQSAGQPPPIVERTGGDSPAQASNALNATYWIDDSPVVLQNGLAEQIIAPGSAVKSKTSVFGRPETGDLDGDGVDDAVLLLVHDPGGSGTFYYLAAAINRQGRFVGTRAVLLGDRIEPLSIVLEDGEVTVRWKQHAAGQPMSASPSVEMSRRLAVDKSEPASLKQVDD